MNRQPQEDNIEADAPMMTAVAHDLEERLRTLDLQLSSEGPTITAAVTEATHLPCNDGKEEDPEKSLRSNCSSYLSSSSSCSILMSEHHQRHLQPKIDTHQKHGRAVHFSEPLHLIAAHIPTIDDIPTLERHDIWWRERDFYAFRMAAKTVSYDLQLLDKNAVERHLERGGYSKANLLALTVVDELALEDLLKTGIRQQSLTTHVQRLVEWTHKGRGLEHWTSRKHHLFRREAMHESRNIVLSLTRDQEAPQEVVKQYQEHSRASRILARLMAEADAITAQQVHAEEVVGVTATATAATAIKPAVAASTVGASFPTALATMQRRTSPSSSLLSSSSTRQPSVASRNRRTYLDRKLPLQHRGIA